MTTPRSSERVPLKCEVDFRRQGENRFRVDLIDFSPGGCCIAPPVRVEAGQSVWLRVPGMEAVHGKVKWVKDWKVGVEFDNPFYPSVFEAVVKKLSG
jgi:hypothetical protein